MLKHNSTFKNQSLIQKYTLTGFNIIIQSKGHSCEMDTTTFNSTLLMTLKPTYVIGNIVLQK
jgi:hypothetical protein